MEWTAKLHDAAFDSLGVCVLVCVLSSVLLVVFASMRVCLVVRFSCRCAPVCIDNKPTWYRMQEGGERAHVYVCVCCACVLIQCVSVHKPTQTAPHTEPKDNTVTTHCRQTLCLVCDLLCVSVVLCVCVTRCLRSIGSIGVKAQLHVKSCMGYVCTC